MITVNNFFAHWVKEISITKYGSDKELPPTFSPSEVYQYSDQMLKHLPKLFKIYRKNIFTASYQFILLAHSKIEEIITLLMLF